MKRPTVASLKRVTPENLASLGVERLAALLAGVAETRPDVKRRLRMELAAAQGGEHLAAEIDRRMGSLDTSRSRVSWRKRPSFVADLDGLRALIADRLTELDRPAALDRLFQFLDLAQRVSPRVKDRDGALEAVFRRAAEDLGGLIGEAGDAGPAPVLVEAMARSPVRWAEWAPLALTGAPPGLAKAALALLQHRQRQAPLPALVPLIRTLADAAGDVDAFIDTFSKDSRRTPSVAAETARRLLAAGRVEAAGAVLEASRGRLAPEFDWETSWIDYLDQSGRHDEAQAARWASFERTLSPERAKAFTQRLADFDDVEAEGRAFAHAAAFADARRGLQFLMDWPALPEAARMIAARADELRISDDQAERWAGQLRPRHPRAAQALLRNAAASAFRRRDLDASERLAREADAIAVD